MSNGLRNCATGVCCPPNGAAAKEALATDMVKGMGCSFEDAKKYADWLLDNYDLAPFGTTGKLYEAVAKLALDHEAKRD